MGTTPILVFKTRWADAFTDKRACRFASVLFLLISLVLLSSCLSDNVSTSIDTSTTDGATSLEAGASDSSDDGAQGQCTYLTEGSAERDYCVSCYDAILSEDCPGAEDVTECKDSTIQDAFTNLVNTCISNSVIAGGLCSTTCPTGSTLDAETCSCSTAESTTISSDVSSDYIDRGQTDYGSPVVTASWPASSSVFSLSLSSSGYSTSTACTMDFSGSNSVWLSVRNRAGTQFRNNAYSTPELGTVSDVYPAYNAAVTVATAPTTEIEGAPTGYNLSASFTVKTGGVGAITHSAFSGDVGWVKSVAGGTTAIIAGATGVSMTGQSFGKPEYFASDYFGNAYVSDSANDKVYLICLNNSAGTYPIGGATNVCSGKTIGNVILKASTADDAALDAPKGLAVDGSGNLVIANSGGVKFAAVCVHLSSVCSTLGATGYQSDIGPDPAAAPLGIDIDVDPTDATKASFNVVYTTSAGVYVKCNGYNNVFCASADAPVVEALSSPQDVKVNVHGNYVYAATATHKVRFYCNDTTDVTDVCSGKTVATKYDLIGTGTATSSTSKEGSLASTSTTTFTATSGTDAIGITYPTRILLAKRYAGDTDTSSTNTFADNNIVFVEAPQVGAALSGNTVRIVCGNNASSATVMQSRGFCKSYSTYTYHRLTGNPGSVGSGASADGSSSRIGGNVNYPFILGITYDNLKNIVLSSWDYCTTDSNGYVAACPAVAGTSTAVISNQFIHFVSLASFSQKTTDTPDEDAIFGLKYTFTDSNGQSSYYCLRFRTQTECSYLTCECVAKPISTGSQSFWTGMTSSESCEDE